LNQVVDHAVMTKVVFNQPTGWLQVRLPEPGTALSYSISSAPNEPTQDPKSWTLEGSDDGNEFTVLDTQTDQAFERRTKVSFPIATPGAYEYYRLNVTANAGSANRLQLSEWDLKWDTLGEQTLIASKSMPNLRDVQENSPLNESLPKLFDGLSSTKWLTYLETNTTPTWVQLHLPTPRQAAKYKITTANDANVRDPSAFKLLASNDGVTWLTLDERAGNPLPNTRQLATTFDVTQNPGSYTYYRLWMAGSRGDTGSGGDANYPGWPRIQLGDLDLLDENEVTVIRGAFVSDPAEAAYGDRYGDSPLDSRPIKAFDHDRSTKWQTSILPNYLQVELEEPTAATSYQLSSASDLPYSDPSDWELFGSLDGETFTSLDVRQNESFANRNTANPAYTIATPTPAKFYRLAINANHQAEAPAETPSADLNITQLSEFELFDAIGTSLTPYSDPFASEWQIGSTNAAWATVDLGGPSVIGRLKVVWAAQGYATSYALDTSPDGEQWTEAFLEEAGDGGVDEIVLSQPVTGVSYVRLRLITASEEALVVQELEVFGTGGAEVALPPQPGPEPNGRQYLTGGNWAVQRAAQVAEQGSSGAQLTSPAYTGSERWLPAQVPGTVLNSFIKAGAVVDPNVADNQLQISDGYFTADFWYRNHFEIPAAQAGKRTWLTFNAINWKADVWFNGQEIGAIAGAFIEGKFDITELANYGGENYLAVLIHRNETPDVVTVQTLETAGKNGGQLGRDNPTIHASVGWDWIPTIRGRNIGIYDDVFLSYSQDVTMAGSWARTTLSGPAGGSNPAPDADVTVATVVTNSAAGARDVTLTGTIQGPNDLAPTPFALPDALTLAAGQSASVDIATLGLIAPDLWWPNTYGDQPLYDVELTATVGGQVSDIVRFKTGIRELEYSFVNLALNISVNGVRITCRGGNWGLSDSNLGLTAADYDTKLRLHAEANFTMIRNWVGQTGDEAFYEAADKYGIMIWDDFWLANPGDGPNPSNEEMFMANARFKILRNRHHAAVGLYCGRNEGNPPASLDAALQAATTVLDGTRYYISHSSGTPNAEDGINTVSGWGPYNVRNPAWYFSNTRKTIHSERGLPNIPSMESMEKMLGPDHQWPMDNVWGMHDFTLGSTTAQNGTSWLDYISNSYAEATSLKEFVDRSQLVGYENYKAVFEAVHAVRANGMLLWMSQSAWPSMVWQVADWYNDTPAAFFGAKTANQPINAFVDPRDRRVFLSNSTPDPLVDAKVAVDVFDLTGTLVASTVTPSTTLTADSGAYVSQVPASSASGQMRFVRTRVLGADGSELARDFTWINPNADRKYQELLSLDTGSYDLSFEPVAEPVGGQPGETQLEVRVANTANAPLFMVHLTVWRPDGTQVLPAYFSDNYFSLMRGEDATVTVNFAAEPEVTVRAEVFNAATVEVSDDAATTADRTILDVAIGLAALFEEQQDRYTPESFAPLGEALAEARALKTAVQLSHAQVVEAIAKLEAAEDALVEAVDTSPLWALIALAEARIADAAQYVPTYLPDVLAQVEAAKALLAGTPSQDQITAQTVELAGVVAKFVKLGDKTVLAALIQVADSLRQARYTTSSWARVEAARVLAGEIETLGDASVDDVADAEIALIDALGALVLRAAKAGLESAITVAKSIIAAASAYVPESLTGLAQAVTVAQTVFEDEDATQDQVAAAQSALIVKIATARLRPAPAETPTVSPQLSPGGAALVAQAPEGVAEAVAQAQAGPAGGAGASTDTGASSAAKAAFVKAPTPKIVGKAKVGRTLKVKVGKWSPKGKLRYQWLRGGKKIRGATKVTYKLKAADRGKRITVKVTATKSGYATAVKKSAKTPKVK
jgi:hypothetical protein